MKKNYPKFNAKNPKESFFGYYSNRIGRLELVFSYMEKKYGYENMKDRIVEMYDHEGILFVHWRSKYSGDKKYQVYIEEAWELVGSEEYDNVYHSFEDVDGHVSGEKLIKLHKW